MLSNRKTKLFILDLDGVLVTNNTDHIRAASLLYPLHGDDTGHYLANCGEKIAILTHRHKAEAEQILHFLEIDRSSIVGCYTAQELWHSAIKHNQILPMITGGMKKSLILPLIKAELGYHPQDIAMIDDGPEILSDMSSNGVGLTMLAPFRVNFSQDTSQTTTFNFAEALTVFREWSNTESTDVPRHISLRERVVTNTTLRQYNPLLLRKRHDLFSVMRKISATLRRVMTRG